MVAFDFVCEQSGQRLDAVIAGQLSERGVSRVRVQRAIKEGCVEVAEALCQKPSQRLEAGVRVCGTIPALEPVKVVPEAMALDILYEDEHLLVVCKPAGLVVHPARGHWRGTLVNGVLAHLGEQGAGLPGHEQARPGIVHRLDQKTSGVMVVAKTAESHHALAQLFASHTIERSYRALVWGCPRSEGVVQGYMVRNSRHFARMTLLSESEASDRPGGKWSLSRYRVVEHYGTVAAQVEVTLETGRTHQIRVHMEHIGHPVIGDEVYGKLRHCVPWQQVDEATRQALRGFPRQALHAGELGFRHPVDGENMRFKREIPEDMFCLHAALRRIRDPQ